MRKPSPLIFVVVIVLVAGLAYLNSLTMHANGGDQSSANSSSSSTPSKPAATPAAVAKGTDTQALITDDTVGNPATASVRMTYGFYADDYVAQHPDQEVAVEQGIISWVQAHPNVSLQIVCLDVPAEMRDDPSLANAPVGLAINGKAVNAPTDIEHGLVVSIIPQILNATAHSGSPKSA